MLDVRGPVLYGGDLDWCPQVWAFLLCLPEGDSYQRHLPAVCVCVCVCVCLCEFNQKQTAIH